MSRGPCDAVLTHTHTQTHTQAKVKDLLLKPMLKIERGMPIGGGVVVAGLQPGLRQ